MPPHRLRGVRIAAARSARFHHDSAATTRPARALPPSGWPHWPVRHAREQRALLSGGRRRPGEVHVGAVRRRARLAVQFPAVRGQSVDGRPLRCGRPKAGDGGVLGEYFGRQIPICLLLLLRTYPFDNHTPSHRSASPPRTPSGRIRTILRCSRSPASSAASARATLRSACPSSPMSRHRRRAVAQWPWSASPSRWASSSDR